MAGLFIKYKWIIFAVVVCWSFALAGRVYVEEAKAVEEYNYDGETGCTSYALGTSSLTVLRQQTFTPTKNNISKVWVQMYDPLGYGGGTATFSPRMKIYQGTPDGSFVHYIGQTSTTTKTWYGGSDYGMNFVFDPPLYAYVGEPMFFQVDNLTDRPFQMKYATCPNPGSRYYNYVNVGYDIPTNVYSESTATPVEPINPNSDYDNVIIYSDPFFERHHLEAPSLQWCVNDNSQPCYIEFSFNDKSWESGIKLYNDSEVGGVTGEYLASTTALDFYPSYNGRILLNHTATSSEGFDYYCLRLYDVDHEYDDEITCGIKVMFLDPSTLTCAWDKTIYQAEHDEGKICDGIATTSVWETGSWAGGMECAGRKIGHYLWTASSSDYYDLCKATLSATEKFPFNIINDLRRRVNNWSTTTEPATSSAILLPFYWNGTSTGVDLLDVNSIRAEGGGAFDTIYDSLVILIWAFASWVIIKDLLALNQNRDI